MQNNIVINYLLSVCSMLVFNAMILNSIKFSTIILKMTDFLQLHMYWMQEKN
jgi:hypothetical protein